MFYYVLFVSVELIVDGCVMFVGKGMVVLFLMKEFDWQGNLKNLEVVFVRYEVINDYGGCNIFDRVFGK